MVRPVRPWQYRFLKEKKWRRLNSNLRVRILPQRLSKLQDVQSMTMPSLDFFEASSISKLATRGLELSHTIRTWYRPRNVGRANVHEIQCCVCLQMMATVKKEARSSHLANPHHILALRVWKNCSCETVVSSSLISFASLDFTSRSNYR